jgi:tellurite resistance protein TehA-like permease
MWNNVILGIVIAILAIYWALEKSNIQPLKRRLGARFQTAKENHILSGHGLDHEEEQPSATFSVWNVVDQAAGNLYPGYFALVMATGIVSIAAYLLQIAPIAWLLFQINKVAYGILLFLAAIRVVKYFPRLAADLTSHSRGPGLLTMISGTCILGSQFVVLNKDSTAGFFFWLFGIILWCILMYAFLTAMMIRERKPDLEAGLNGDWLITVVATQSISLLGTLVAPRFGAEQEAVLFLTLSTYLLGCVLYILIISLIFYRLTFFALTPAEFTPSYWVNMGAVAITTLAGSMLILIAPQWSFLQEILPFLKGFTLFFWVIGTWWIPLIMILEAWRHLFNRFPIRYDPRHWDIVFPLGMYTIATFELGKATGLPFLIPASQYFIYFALVAWASTFIGLIHRLFNSCRPAVQRAGKR